MADDKVKVLFVCLGNICRSPLAEGVFRHLVTEAGLAERIDIDSAGTADYHIGDPPDERTIAVARSRGIELTSKGRQIRRNDLAEFDYVLVMDRQNLRNVQKLSSGRALKANIRMLREYDEHANGPEDVPDPYYGGVRGFEEVHDIVERSCRALLEHIRQAHQL